MKTEKNSKFKIIIITILAIAIILAIAGYTTNSNFRNFIDSELLNKHVSENNLSIIEINSDDNPVLFAYEDYIGVFAKNKLSIYNDKSELINELTINITTPLIKTNGKYIIISEDNGNKFYVINSTNLLWQGKFKK